METNNKTPFSLEGLDDYIIIKHIPHASTSFPYSYYQSVVGISDISVYKLADLFVDILFKDIKGIEIKAKYSRLYCDVERYKDNDKEPMMKYGQGYMYSRGYKDNVFNRHVIHDGLDIDRDVDTYYDEHHRLLTEETKKILSRGKKVLLLDLHSFSSEQAMSIGKEPPFPDICIGYNDECLDENVLKRIINLIKDRGYSYRINYPYAGSIIPIGLTEEEKNNVCSIMIEINKRLYL